MTAPRGYDYASVDDDDHVDPARLAADGASFAIVRGSYERWADPTAKRDAARLRAAGLVFGAFMAPLPGKGHPTGKEQVATFAAGAPVERGDMPPTIDVEFPRGIAATGLTRAELLAWVIDAVEQMRKTFGVSPMIYTSKRSWDGEDTDSLDADTSAALGAIAAAELADCPLWLAKYLVQYKRPQVPSAYAPPWPPTPAAWGEGNHWIHQEQGDAVGIPGLGQADVDRFRVASIGETGPRVRRIQRNLKMVEGAPGIFDDTTRSAVREYQTARGLAADGIIGPRTFAHLFGVR